MSERPTTPLTPQWSEVVMHATRVLEGERPVRVCPVHDLARAILAADKHFEHLEMQIALLHEKVFGP